MWVTEIEGFMTFYLIRKCGVCMGDRAGLANHPLILGPRIYPQSRARKAIVLFQSSTTASDTEVMPTSSHAW